MKISDDNDDVPTITEGIYGPLDGHRQLVHRAELNAAVQILHVLDGKPGDVHLISDCKYVTDGFWRMGIDNEHSSEDCDLWIEMQDLVSARERNGFSTTIAKVKSHVDAWHIEAGMITWKDFTGNEYADAFAGVGAKICQVDEDKVVDIQRIDKLAKNVQKRILAANIDALKNVQEEVEDDTGPLAGHAAPPSEPIPEQYEQRVNGYVPDDHAGHVLRKSYSFAKRKTFWKCQSCLASCSARKLTEWLSKSRCPAESAPQEDGPDEHAHPSSTNVEAPSFLGDGEHDEYDVFGHAALGMDDDGQGSAADDHRHGSPPGGTAAVPVPAETPRERLRRLQASAATRTASTPRPAILASQLNLGHLHLHHSHLLHHRRGVVWCWKCGAYGTEALRNLSRPCAIQPARAGKVVLSRLKDGHTPRVGMEWPLGEGVGLASGPVLVE